MRSNVNRWKELQDDDYFGRHPWYTFRALDPTDKSGEIDIRIMDKYFTITPDHRVVVIGCGYGRETAPLARRCRELFAIDVNDTILERAKQYLHDRNVHNVEFVLADEFDHEIPNGINLVFSITVMQNLTR